MLNRLLSVSVKPSLLAIAVVLSPLVGQSQTTVRVKQTFTTDPPVATELPFTATVLVGGIGQTGYFDPITGQAGLGAYGAFDGDNNNTGNAVQLDFLERTFAFGSGSAASPNKLTFSLASLGAPSGGRGFEANSKVEVYLDINRAGFPTIPQLKIIGPVTNGPIYGFGSGTTQTSDSGTPTVVLLASGTNSNPSTGPSTIIITLPSSATSGTRVAVRIVVGAANKAEILIDDVTLSSGNGTPLPVELTRFDASTKGSSVGLSWATASEKNSAYFEVQRSATGEAYESIGRVAAQGTSSSLREYAFSDARPLAGLAYYRLRQVDTDGTAAFSPVATVRRNGEIAVYPNPATDAVTLPTSLGAVRYRVLNGLGQVLASGQAVGGDRLDLSALPKGSFFLELSDAAGRRTQRLIRQ